MRTDYEQPKTGTTPDRGLFELATGAAVGTVQVSITYVTVHADVDLAEAFQIEEGAELLERRYLLSLFHRPVAPGHGAI
jgi:hypothetical protein